MSTRVPYLARPGSLKAALERIRTAATPTRVTGDFMSSTLNIKGGTGAALIPYLKKVGFVASDGTPTEIYRTFRNQSKSGLAVADAVKVGYAPLGQVNETFYALPDKDLKDLIVQVTGAAADSSTVRQMLGTLRILISFADFKEPAKPDPAAMDEDVPDIGKAVIPEVLKPANGIGANEQAGGGGRVGLNLAYTINLNLPATTDQAVFNAIFKSLKEHLLSNDG